MNCRECKHHRPIPGDNHIQCVHKSAGAFIGFLSMLETGCYAPMNVVGNPHGIANGWFQWPVNFDPIWMTSQCNAFEAITNESPQN